LRTTIINKKNDLKPTWFLINGENKTLGRVASKIATLLRGKWRANYSPADYFGDHVVVVNSDKIILTGRKPLQKIYYKHTGYMGGLREMKYADMKQKHPEYPLKKAVKGMLPKNILGRKMLLNLKIYEGNNHPHKAQKPMKIDF
jgi:large subunit ribosomal protein L13